MNDSTKKVVTRPKYTPDDQCLIVSNIEIRNALLRFELVKDDKGLDSFQRLRFIATPKDGKKDYIISCANSDGNIPIHHCGFRANNPLSACMLMNMFMDRADGKLGTTFGDQKYYISDDVEVDDNCFWLKVKTTNSMIDFFQIQFIVSDSSGLNWDQADIARCCSGENVSIKSKEAPSFTGSIIAPKTQPVKEASIQFVFNEALTNSIQETVDKRVAESLDRIVSDTFEKNLEKTFTKVREALVPIQKKLLDDLNFNVIASREDFFRSNCRGILNLQEKITGFKMELEAIDAKIKDLYAFKENLLDGLSGLIIVSSMLLPKKPDSPKDQPETKEIPTQESTTMQIVD